MSNAPSAEWMPFIKMGFGYFLLAGVLALAMIFGLGHVEEKTSYGLPMLLGCLTTLVGSFSTWAFGAVMQALAASKEGS